jgi:TolB-like protein
VNVTVRDAWGVSVDSGWSSPYVILPLASRDIPIAVLPLENLTGERAPTQAVLERIRAGLVREGFRIIHSETLERFLHRHRIRVASGLDRTESRAIKEATGAEAVLVTSFAAYQERPPPHASLFARLVSTGDDPKILWMDSVGLSGEDSVRLLGIGRIEETGALLENVVNGVTDALARYVPEPIPEPSDLDAADADDTQGRLAASPPGLEDAIDLSLLENTGGGGIPPDASSPPASGPEDSGVPPKPRRRYQPKTVFGSRFGDPRERYSVAVVPFVNRSETKNAGKIMALHFVEELYRVEGLRVVDPGLVREEMLRYRTVIPEGPSLETADVLSDEGSLGVDLLLSGTVFDYGGPVVPKVEFSLEILDTDAREVVWTSRSYNDGEEAVYFLDVGRVYTAHRLAAGMARAAVEELSR